MSSSKPKKGFSLGRKRSIKKEKPGDDSVDTPNEDHLQHPPPSPAESAERDRMAAEVADLAHQLEETRDEADSLKEQMAQDKERISELERKLEEANKEAHKWEGKAEQYEKASADLDDESYDAAQAFQIKKELDGIRKELATHDEMKQELIETKQELVEIRSHNEELLLQQSRRSTRTDMQRIRTEKTTREDVERLHKELRQMERNSTSQMGLMEAQLKASKDSLQRAAEKAQAIQRRLDLVDKERMDIKLENQKLSRKLEKADSYAEKKRAQLEAQTHELEISNLKRKAAKLEKRLTLSTMNLSEIDEIGPFNISSPAHRDSRRDSRTSSGSNSPIQMTLSEARVVNLEKEVYALEEKNSALETENESLRDELSATKQEATILGSQVLQLQAGIGEEKKVLEDAMSQLSQYQNHTPNVPDISNVPNVSNVPNGTSHDEQLVHELQQEIKTLKKVLEDKTTEMRVRLKEMKATNDELKRQVEELEMEKLRLELGEDEEEEEEEEEEGEGEGEAVTDIEEDKKDAAPADTTEIRTMRERLMSLQDELSCVSQNNEQLKNQLQKQKEEAELFVQSIENELSEVKESEEQVSREQRLADRNEELKTKLKEQQEMYNDTIREISRLKNILTEQV